MSAAEWRAVAKGLLPYRGAEDDPEPPEGGALASVAVVLRPARPSPELLLIRRARSEPDPWSGQIALPGGHHNAGDRSLVETAARETREETGIPLSRVGTLLGRLTAVAPKLPIRRPLLIAPFVYAVPAATLAHLASREVAEVFWVPLIELEAEASSTVFELETPQGTRSFPAFDVGGRVVWGLTHRILTELLGGAPYGSSTGF